MIINKQNNLFDKIEIIDGYLDSEVSLDMYYTAIFWGQNKGFNYRNSKERPFKDVGCGDRDEREYRFNSVNQILSVIPEAKKYDDGITNIEIERYIKFKIAKNNLLLIRSGNRTIGVE